MIAIYIAIWILLYLCLKYDLKQSNVKSLLRATLLTLLAYVSIDLVYREGLTLDSPDADDITNNDITIKFNKYKKKHKRCKYIRKQKTLSIANYNQALKDVSTLPAVVEDNYNTSTLDEIRGNYNPQFSIIQNSFNDLASIKTADQSCDKHDYLTAAQRNTQQQADADAAAKKAAKKAKKKKEKKKGK